MGGRFRSVMPSDLVKVGAIARESLPAPSVEYATPASRIELRRLFSRCGAAAECQYWSCGSGRKLAALSVTGGREEPGACA